MSKTSTRQMVYMTLVGSLLLGISSVCFVNCASSEHNSEGGYPRSGSHRHSARNGWRCAVLPDVQRNPRL